MDDLIKYIFGTIGLSVGGILGFLCRSEIENRLALGRIKENIKITEFNKAAAEFRAAFVDEEYRLRKCDLTTFFGCYAAIKDRDESIIITHEKARILFEPFIDKKDISGFNSAWEIYTNTWPQYLKKYEEDKVPDFLSYYYSFMYYAQPK